MKSVNFIPKGEELYIDWCSKVFLNINRNILNNKYQYLNSNLKEMMLYNLFIKKERKFQTFGISSTDNFINLNG